MPPQLSLPSAAAPLWRIAMPLLEWNEQSRARRRRSTRIAKVVPEIEWPFFAPYVKAINALRRAQRGDPGAYQTPEICNCVGVGIRSTRARGDQGRRRHHRAMRRTHFMAELRDPQSRQTVLSDLKAGCSLASSIPVRTCACCARNSGRARGRLRQHLRRREAEVDIYCTSSNAVKWSSLGADTVIFRDQYLPNTWRRRPR
jgi:quinolinate synthase